MTNFKKGLSFSVFAVLALACCLVISQAFAAELPTKAQLQQERNLGKLDSQVPGSVVTSVQSAAPQIDRSAASASADEGSVLEIRPKLKGMTAVMPEGPFRGGGEDIAGAVAIGAIPYMDQGTNAGAADDYDVDCGETYTDVGGLDVVYSYTPTVLEYLDFSLCDAYTDYDTKLYVYEDNETNPVACSEDYCGLVSAVFNVQMNPGHVYYVVVDAYSGADAGLYQLDVTVGVDPMACTGADIAETEVCGTDVNGGCNMAAGTEYWEPTAPGTSHCGTLWADGGRDTDWFTYTVTNSTGEVLTWNGVVEAAPFALFILDDACAIITASGFGPDAPDNVEAYLAPGTYYFMVAINGFDGFPCGTGGPVGDVRYRAWLDGRDVNPIDDCELPASITTAGVYPFDLNLYTPGQSLVGFAGNNMWFELDPPAVGIAHIEMTVVEALVYHVGMAAGAACGGNAFAAAGTPWGSPYPWTMEFPAIPGNVTMVEVAVHGPAGFGYTGQLDVTYLPLPPLTNDICLSTATDLGSGDTGDVFFHNVGATWTYLPDDYYDQGMLGTDVWFTWTATMTGLVEFTTCQSIPGFDSRAELYLGGACLDTDPRQPIVGDDDFCSGGGMSAFFFEAVASQTYLLRFGGWYRDPDYLPPSQGTGYLSFTEDLGISSPANNNCVDAVPFVLSNGVGVTEYGDQSGMNNSDCLILDPTTWHAFTPDTCMDLIVNYDGTDDNSGDGGFWWLIDDYMLDDCPCYGANQVIGLQSYYADPLFTDGRFSHSAEFEDLLPKTYYYPVYSGVNDYVAEDYQINFLGTAKECDYCAATANPGVCAFGYEYIYGVAVADLNNDNNGCNGYQDFTGLTAPGLYRSVPHLMTITLGDAIGSDTTGVWVDWNQNFDLMVAADWVATTSDGNGGVGPWFATLTPPADAKNPGDPGISGYTLMRVRCNDGGVDDPVACGANVYGEVEDYIVEVLDWVCGDADGNGTFGPEDVTFLVDMYFNGGAVPAPWQAGDANADGFVNIADIVFVAEALNGGAAPICLP